MCGASKGPPADPYSTQHAAAKSQQNHTATGNEEGDEDLEGVDLRVFQEGEIRPGIGESRHVQRPAVHRGPEVGCDVPARPKEPHNEEQEGPKLLKPHI